MDYITGSVRKNAYQVLALSIVKWAGRVKPFHSSRIVEVEERPIYSRLC